MAFQNILARTEGAVGVITLNRPAALNALNTQLLGELSAALRAGFPPGRIVFAGVGKNDEEITYALEKGILLFNVESEEELANIDRIAGKVGRKAPVALTCSSRCVTWLRRRCCSWKSDRSRRRSSSLAL